MSALSHLIALALVTIGCASSTTPADLAVAPTSLSPEGATSSTTTGPPTTTSRAAAAPSSSTVLPIPRSSLPQDDAGRWQRIDLAPQIAAGSLVAAGPRGTVVFGAYAFGNSPGTSGWFSADGSNWKPIEGLQRMIDGGDHSFASGWGWVTALAAWHGGFVAVGVHVTFPDSQTVRGGAAAWSSPDGRTWTRVGDIDTFGSQNVPMALVRGADAFVALTSRTTDNTGPPTLGPVTAWRSVDGQSWQQVTIDAQAYASSIAATSFGFVAAGLGSGFSPQAPTVLPAIWISADGIDWRRINTDVFHSAPSQFAFSQVVAHGRGAALIARQFESSNVSDNALTILMTSTDGERWRAITAPPCLTAARRDYIIDFAAAEDRLMILASIGEIPTIITGTPHGAQWRCVRLDPDAFPTTAWGPVNLLRLAANPNGSFSIIGGTALEPGNKPNFRAAVWTENR